MVIRQERGLADFTTYLRSTMHTRLGKLLLHILRIIAVHFGMFNPNTMHLLQKYKIISANIISHKISTLVGPSTRVYT